MDRVKSRLPANRNC